VVLHLRYFGTHVDYAVGKGLQFYVAFQDLGDNRLELAAGVFYLPGVFVLHDFLEVLFVYEVSKFLDELRVAGCLFELDCALGLPLVGAYAGFVDCLAVPVAGVFIPVVGIPVLEPPGENLILFEEEPDFVPHFSNDLFAGHPLLENPSLNILAD
jgi:hypothetical protein